MKVIYDLFDVTMPLAAPEEKTEKDIFRDDGDKPEKKNTTFRGSSQLRKRECYGVAGTPNKID